MKPREKFIAALERRPITGRVPHFELEFFLTMEAFGRIHPSQRRYNQWIQMSESEKELHRRDVAEVTVEIARRFEHSGILLHTPKPWANKDIRRCLEIIREISGMDYLLMLHGDPTFALPDGTQMMQFASDLTEKPEAKLDEAQRETDKFIADAEEMLNWGVLDGFCLCSDYCFNTGPFLSPAMFDTFVTPYLQQVIGAYREMGYYVIKHTDGNIMPILDSLLSARPHALHSLDPQGEIDMKVIKEKAGDQVCLIGNVNCAALQTGTEEEVIESTTYALKHGMPGGGYIFSTSNCIYTGMPLERYELMLNIWREYGNYPEVATGQSDLAEAAVAKEI